MKLLQVNDHSAVIGGVESYLADVSRLLREAGHEVAIVYGVQSDQQLTGTIHCPEVMPGGNTRERLCRIREVVEGIAPDVILAHHIEDADVLRLFSELRPTFQFVHVHSRFVCPGRGKYYARTEEPCHRPFAPYCLIAPFIHSCGTKRPWRIAENYRMTSRWLEAARELRGLIVTSDYMKRELIEVGLPEAKIAVNPLFAMPVSTAKSEIRNLKLEIGKGLPVILFCGRMYDYKGAEFLLRALERLAISVQAVFIGDGPELPKLNEQAIRLRSHHAIEFTGWLGQEVVHEFYRQANVVVVPSLWPEPFGRVGIEAMAYGKPVVAFRVGGISEWLQDGQNGFLVEPKNIKQLAEAIERILTDKQLAEAMSASALKLAAELFSSQRHVRKLIEVLTSGEESSLMVCKRIRS